ncbi:unnamed protein product [Penicillium pancosmium]
MIAHTTDPLRVPPSNCFVGLPLFYTRCGQDFGFANPALFRAVAVSKSRVADPGTEVDEWPVPPSISSAGGFAVRYSGPAAAMRLARVLVQLSLRFKWWPVTEYSGDARRTAD